MVMKRLSILLVALVIALFAMIGAALKRAGHDVVIYCPDLRPIDWHDVLTADLVGLSSITSTVPMAYETADRLRRRDCRPGITGFP
jgi:hypothetical protein